MSAPSAPWWGPLAVRPDAAGAIEQLRRTGAPVLVTTAPATEPPATAVVGIDGSAASLVAARAALGCLAPRGAIPPRLVLVTVRPPRATDAPADSPHGERRLDAAAALLATTAPRDVLVQQRLTEGDVAGELLATAERVDADLVAVGTHGPGFLERLVVGSVATAVLARATTSVLIAPPPAPGERVHLELLLGAPVAVRRPDEWAPVLAFFTDRNAGRPARIEHAAAPAGAPEPPRAGLTFRAAVVDAPARRLTLVFDGDTLAIDHVRSLEIVGRDATRDHALLVESAGGYAVLTLVG